ncbi:MAG: XRE family transcriptional regulator [Paracoccus sp. (in: a-proteobacteria)]|nr:XRE family transcriptional regulator [Paracoccus sp. (in: a-proteobacteria)]
MSKTDAFSPRRIAVPDLTDDPASGTVDTGAVPLADAAAPSCGPRIRHLRHKLQMKLGDLAQRAGISTGFLSQVERDKAAPSLGTLAALARALDVDTSYFIASPRPRDGLGRAERRERFQLDPDGVSYERVSAELPGSFFNSVIAHVPPGYRSELTAHMGEELVVVLEGHVRQTLAGQVFDLGPGDTMHFMGDTPHSFGNVTDAPARLLWVGTAPIHGRGLSANEPTPTGGQD